MDDIPPCTSALGTGGRVFESLRSDHQFNPAFAGFFCFQVESRRRPNRGQKFLPRHSAHQAVNRHEKRPKTRACERNFN